MTYQADWCVEMYKCVYSCKYGEKCIDITDTIYVGRWKWNLVAGKNLIFSYSIYTNIEYWTYWYGSQPHIGEVTDYIMSWWLLLPVAQGRTSVIFRRNATT